MYAVMNEQMVVGMTNIFSAIATCLALAGGWCLGSGLPAGFAHRKTMCRTVHLSAWDAKPLSRSGGRKGPGGESAKIA